VTNRSEIEAAFVQEEGNMKMAPLVRSTPKLRKLFEDLNQHKGKGIARHHPGHRPNSTRLLIPSGADSDVFNEAHGAPKNSASIKWSNNGGGMMNAGKLYVVFWGSAWAKSPPPNPSAQDLVNDFASILSGPYQAALAQYFPYQFQKTMLGDAWIDPRSVPGYKYTIVDTNYEAWLMMTNGPINADSNTMVCVVMPPGSEPAGNTGVHSWSVLPDLRQVPVMYVAYNGNRRRMTCNFSHELVETITDPFGDAVQLEPRAKYVWNEIADVCGNCALQNGVNVQSYWSYIDKLCIIPQSIVITSWQITCIRKRYGSKMNANQNIDLVAGIHIPTGQKFWMKQKEVISRIDKGDRFFVQAPDGTQAEVKVCVHFPPWNPKGTRYIATVADDTKLDNLLSLPECIQGDL
jgi:hypothetical protein